MVPSYSKLFWQLVTEQNHFWEYNQSISINQSYGVLIWEYFCPLLVLFILDWMAVRVNTQELDNTGIQGEGIITHCSFNSDGSTLAVSDREGNICLYQTNPTSAPSYLTEFSTSNNPSFYFKQASTIHTIEQLQPPGFQKIITADQSSVKIWSYQNSDILYPNISGGPQNSKGLYLQPAPKPQLKEEISVSSVSMGLDSQRGNIVCQDGESLTLINLEKKREIYRFSPSLTFRPMFPQRSLKQSKLDFSERLLAEMSFWQEINPITKVKFQGKSPNLLGYSNKLGEVHCLDSRIAQNKDLAVRVGTPRGRSTAECCLNIVSDFIFLESGHELLSRDFLYIYKWDLKYPKSYLQKRTIYPSINSQICSLYQQGQIYNQFLLKSNPSGSNIFTTHFQQSFHEINTESGTNLRYKQTLKGLNIEKVQSLTSQNLGSSSQLQGSKSLQCFDFAPNTNTVCSATGKTIRFYSLI